MTEDVATYSVLIVSAGQVPGGLEGAVAALRGEFKLSQDSAEHVARSIPAVVKRRATLAAAQSMVAMLKGHGFEARMVRSGGTGAHRAVSVSGEPHAVSPEQRDNEEGGLTAFERAEPTWRHTGDHAGVRRRVQMSRDSPDVTRFGPPLRSPTGDPPVVAEHPDEAFDAPDDGASETDGEAASAQVEPGETRFFVDDAAPAPEPAAHAPGAGDPPTVRRFGDDEVARDALLMTGSPPSVRERPALRPPTPETVPPVFDDDGEADAAPWQPPPARDDAEARRRRVLETPELGHRDATFVAEQGWSRAGDVPAAEPGPVSSFAVPEALLPEAELREARQSERIDKITAELPSANADLSDLSFPGDLSDGWLATPGGRSVLPTEDPPPHVVPSVEFGDPIAAPPPVDEGPRSRVQDELAALGDDDSLGPGFGVALDNSGGVERRATPGVGGDAPSTFGVGLDDSVSPVRRKQTTSSAAHVPRGREIDFGSDPAEASGLPGEDDPNERSGIELPDHDPDDDARRTETHGSFEEELAAINDLYSGDAEPEVRKPRLNTIELQAVRDSRPPAVSGQVPGLLSGQHAAVRTTGSFEATRRRGGGGRRAHWLLMTVMLLILASIGGAVAFMYVQRSQQQYAWDQADRYYEFRERIGDETAYRGCVRIVKGDYLCRYDVAWFQLRFPEVEAYVAAAMSEACWGRLGNDGKNASESVECSVSVDRAGGTRSFVVRYDRRRDCQEHLLSLERNEATRCTTTVARSLESDRSERTEYEAERFESTYEFERPRSNLSTEGGYFDALEFTVTHGDNPSVLAFYADSLGLFVREGRPGSAPVLEVIHENEPGQIHGTPVLDRFTRSR